MHIDHFRIHLINGQVIHVSEGRNTEEAENDLIDRFRDALPEGLLEVGADTLPTAYIPANNILYISRGVGEFVP